MLLNDNEEAWDFIVLPVNFPLYVLLIKSSPFQMKNVRIKSSSEECRMQNDDARRRSDFFAHAGPVSTINQNLKNSAPFSRNARPRFHMLSLDK
jgi:hypothetical protein